MREILGYAPVQPDGSVQIQVPAQVPFTIDVLDANGRRITAQHTSWLQLQPGEVKSCNGCHTAGNVQYPSHGRSGLTLPVNPGAPTTGAPFPDTNPALFANAGETMAQTLARISCETGSPLANLPAPNTQPCSQILTTDVLYPPIWTTGITTPAGSVDKTFLLYLRRRGGHPEDTAHEWQLRAVERSVPHHHPLCECEFQPAATIYPEPLEFRRRATRWSNGVMTSVTCTLCHNTVNAMKAVQVPAGQTRSDRRRVERRHDGRHIL